MPDGKLVMESKSNFDGSSGIDPVSKANRPKIKLIILQLTSSSTLPRLLPLIHSLGGNCLFKHILHFLESVVMHSNHHRPKKNLSRGDDPTADKRVIQCMKQIKQEGGVTPPERLDLFSSSRMASCIKNDRVRHSNIDDLLL